MNPGGFPGSFGRSGDSVLFQDIFIGCPATCLSPLGFSAEHIGTPVRMLIHNLDVIVINRDTGEILRELVLDPNKDSQPRGLKPGPKKGSPRQGGMKKGYRYTNPPIRKSRDIR